jgi:hypothetical protein
MKKTRKPSKRLNACIGKSIAKSYANTSVSTGRRTPSYSEHGRQYGTKRIARQFKPG